MLSNHIKIKLLGFVIILLIITSSFSEGINLEDSSNSLTKETVEIWKYTNDSVEYYLTLYNDEQDNICFALRNVGKYFYFGTIVKQGEIYTLDEPHYLNKNMKLKIIVEEHSIKLSAKSERLGIDIDDLLFTKTTEKEYLLELIPKVKKGYDWFVSDEFMNCIENGNKVRGEISSGIKSYDMLTFEEKRNYNLSYEYTSYYPWWTQGDGCSWYCAVKDYKVDSTSTLELQEDSAYLSSAIHDESVLTAWIEGEIGDGIGESVSISFPSGNPRVTKICIYNGYQKSKNTYYNNNRVKVLTLFINDNKYCKLFLEDTPREQVFDIDMTTLVNSNIKLEFKFRIDEVYNGELYSDTAISEINFDGIDDH
jgi:hypothetical protein